MSEPVSSLWERMLIEQERQTELLRQIARNQTVLIRSLAEDQDEEPDAMPTTYMDGSPCR